jgi:hypothetical protein
MTSISQEILRFLHLIVEQPEMCAGTPESAHGMFLALAAVVLNQEVQRPIDVCLRDLWLDLVIEATKMFCARRISYRCFAKSVVSRIE